MNIELTTKVNRLQESNQQLSSDYQFYSQKVQSLEMELEMTKSTSDRDIESLIEQQKQQKEMDKIIQETDKAKD